LKEGNLRKKSASSGVLPVIQGGKGDLKGEDLTIEVSPPGVEMNSPFPTGRSHLSTKREPWAENFLGGGKEGLPSVNTAMTSLSLKYRGGSKRKVSHQESYGQGAARKRAGKEKEHRTNVA